MRTSRARSARPALLLALAGAAIANTASAQAFSVSAGKARYGWNFSEPGLSEDIPKSVIGFENTRAWSWGSHYLFIDFLRSWSDADANAKEVYGEWYPSMSLGKVFGWKIPLKFVRDVRFTVGLNGGVRSTGPAPLVVLPGFTFDLNLPAFQFFSVGTYAYIDRGRFQGHLTGCTSTTFQVTPSWALPFTLGSAHFTFNGFADFIGGHGDCVSQILSQPDLRLDISRFWNKPGRIFAGVQYAYWHNKYGVQDLQDNVIMPLLVWSF
jgi:nucleoside-specific outer membrane channel protein Tsx